MFTYVTTSWDDGHRLDLRLAELLDKYDIPATFYIPINYADKKCLTNQEIKQIAKKFDVGGHTYHHADLTRLSAQNIKTEIVEGKKKLQEIVGREIFSLAYPYGLFNNTVVRIVKQTGFIGARNINLFTRCWTDPFRMSTTVNAVNLSPYRYVKDSLSSHDYRFFSFILKDKLLFKNWYELAIRTLDFIAVNGGIWHLWGHSWEIDSYDDWGVLEEVLKRVSVLPSEVNKVNNTQLLQIRGKNL